MDGELNHYIFKLWIYTGSTYIITITAISLLLWIYINVILNNRLSFIYIAIKCFLIPLIAWLLTFGIGIIIGPIGWVVIYKKSLYSNPFSIFFIICYMLGFLFYMGSGLILWKKKFNKNIIENNKFIWFMAVSLIAFSYILPLNVEILKNKKINELFFNIYIKDFGFYANSLSDYYKKFKKPAKNLEALVHEGLLQQNKILSYSYHKEDGSFIYYEPVCLPLTPDSPKKLIWVWLCFGERYSKCLVLSKSGDVRILNYDVFMHDLYFTHEWLAKHSK